MAATTEEISVPARAVPGTMLGLAAEYVAGPGTHIHDGQVVASLAGLVSVLGEPASPPSPPFPPSLPATAPPKRLNRVTSTDRKQQTQQEQGSQPQRPESRPVISVSRPNRRRDRLPDVGNTVLCRVMRLTPRQAIVSIQQVENTPLETEWQGVIRVQDVRATEKDRIKIAESFRTGDVVQAQVISLGDQANYYLTTALNELGVIMAKSEAGNAMIPLSWREFRDPVTGQTELRKVAKP